MTVHTTCYHPYGQYNYCRPHHSCKVVLSCYIVSIFNFGIMINLFCFGDPKRFLKMQAQIEQQLFLLDWSPEDQKRMNSLHQMLGTIRVIMEEQDHPVTILGGCNFALHRNVHDLANSLSLFFTPTSALSKACV